VLEKGGQGIYLLVCRGRSDEEIGAAPGSEGFISNLKIQDVTEKKTH